MRKRLYSTPASSLTKKIPAQAVPGRKWKLVYTLV
jgi:hypothetical protein